MPILGDILERVGFRFGQVLIDDLSLRNVFFRPWTSTKQVTTEAIDGDINTDIDTYTKLNQQEYLVEGYFQDYIFLIKKYKVDFEKLYRMYLENKIFKFTGTDFDNKNFIITSISKVDEGLNFIRFSFVAKEVIFAQILEFEEEVKEKPQIGKSKKVVAVAKLKEY